MTCKAFEQHVGTCPSCRRLAQTMGASELGRKGGSVSSPAKKRAAKLRQRRIRQQQKEKRSEFMFRESEIPHQLGGEL